VLPLPSIPFAFLAFLLLSIILTTAITPLLITPADTRYLLFWLQACSITLQATLMISLVVNALHCSKRLINKVPNNTRTLSGSSTRYQTTPE